MIEQLNLFESLEPPRVPDQSQARPHPLAGSWWKPVTDYRYNENGRPSGWVRIKNDCIALVSFDELKRKLYAGYYVEAEQRYLCWGWITEQDIKQYFNPAEQPAWWNNDN